MKTCNHCKKNQPFDSYGSHKGWKDGRHGTCKSCIRQSRLVKGKAYTKKHTAYCRGWNSDPEIRKRTNAQKQSSLALKRGAVKCTCCTQESLTQFYMDRPDGLVVDHIVECWQGGPHCLSNLQYLSQHENLIKSRDLRYNKGE